MYSQVQIYILLHPKYLSAVQKQLERRQIFKSDLNFFLLCDVFFMQAGTLLQSWGAYDQQLSHEVSNSILPDEN